MDELNRNVVGILINNKTERKTKGLIIEKYNSEKNQFYNTLKKKYGNPQILSPEIKQNEKLGYSAYYWVDGNHYIFLITNYNIVMKYSQNDNKKMPNIDDTVIIIENDTTVPTQNDQLVIDRLMTSLKQ